MTNMIVQVNTSVKKAVPPSTLQRKGAMLSQGGTTLAPNATQQITQLSDLTGILATAKAVTSLAQTVGLATLTTTSPHGWTNGDVIPVIVAGASPAGYNGTVTATVTGASTLTYAVSSGLSSPATGTIVVQLGDEAELLTQGTQFFAQGSNTAFSVLELGEGTAVEGVAALTTWITNNPGTFYSYLVPREWNGVSQFISFLGTFNTATSVTYFHITTGIGNYASYAGMKCVLATIQNPDAPSSEFTAAAQFWRTLSWRPSSTTRVPPLCYSFLQDVTAFPTSGNASLLVTLAAAGVNVVGTGQAGGLSDFIDLYGTTMDNVPFNFWYSTDWAQIQGAQSLTAAIIQGSNDLANPLYFNQQGINTLQDVLTQLYTNGVTYGLGLGQVIQTQLTTAQFEENFDDGLYEGKIVVNAVPFLDYIAANPTDYNAGLYSGFSAIWRYRNGFRQLIFNLTSTQFA